MKIFTTALYAKFTAAPGGVHNGLYNDIVGNLYEGQAPAGAVFPYVVYSIVSDVPDWNFTDRFEDVLIQFSLFSTAPESTEVKDMYTHLKALYDDCSLTIAGSTLVWFRRVNTITLIDEVTTTEGTEMVWTYHVDYEAKVEAS